MNRVFLLGRIQGHIQKGEKTYEGISRFYAFLPVMTVQLDQKITGGHEHYHQTHQVIVWDDLAQKCVKNLNDGDGVFVEGKLQSQLWKTDRGEEQRITQILAFKVECLSQKQPKETRED